MSENSSKEMVFRPVSARSTLLGVLLIVVSLSAYAFFTSPLSAKVDVVRADLTAKNGQLETLRKKLVSLEQAQKNLDLTNEVQKIESLKAVPDKMYQDQVIKELIKIAGTYSIQLKSIGFSKGSGPKENTGSLKINASFEGNYLDLTDFLEGIEQNARIFRVSSISVQLSKLEISDVERVNFSLVIETFFQKSERSELK